MNERLVNILASRRLEAGEKVGHPLSYHKMAKSINSKMQGPTLYRFINGTKRLGVVNLRMIADWANRNDDVALLQALGFYALGVDLLADNSTAGESCGPT